MKMHVIGCHIPYVGNARRIWLRSPTAFFKCLMANFGHWRIATYEVLSDYNSLPSQNINGKFGKDNMYDV